MQATLLIRSSSRPDDSYELHFEFANDDCLKLRCYCPAGKGQDLCKHVIALLSGNREFIFDARQDSVFDDALTVADRSGAVAHCREMLAELDRIEKDFKQRKKEYEAAKRELKNDLCERLREGKPFKI
ncbi:MAG TPA: SWIM zinc finger family protein [Pyrinomonadaceae bacterium]|nr:SWIM zinc finger family protein [Pyrinomonadaceae bacterium]